MTTLSMSVYSSLILSREIFWRNKRNRASNHYRNRQETRLFLNVYFVPTFAGPTVGKSQKQPSDHSVYVFFSAPTFSRANCWQKKNRQTTTLSLSVYSVPRFVKDFFLQKQETGKQSLCLCLFILLLYLLEKYIGKQEKQASNLLENRHGPCCF